jgi:hypothetical protein
MSLSMKRFGVFERHIDSKWTAQNEAQLDWTRRSRSLTNGLDVLDR